MDIKCEGCGAKLTYQPGTTSLTCAYCDHTMAIADATAQQQAQTEQDFDLYLQSREQQADILEQYVLQCQGCGAETQLAPDQQSSRCPFCDTALVMEQKQTRKLIKPQGVLPFRLARKEAQAAFNRWLKGLWFAPNKLKRQTTRHDRFEGVYLPFWTYDCETDSRYTGQRGDDYTVQVQSTDSKGNTVTRSETRTRWHSVRGEVSNSFDDILVPGSRSLPRDKLDALQPWELSEVVDYRDEFLVGYRTETYQVSARRAYDDAKDIMDDAIRQTIRRDIGGDHQRIDNVDSRYYDRTFKHLLLPVWVSAYRFGDEVYRVLVNAQTGEVQGERPWSWVKIGLTVIAGLAVAGAIAYLVNSNAVPQ
ncbi:hypothetical protein C4K68_27740 [Pokkaliibacter plantistimulans]|uniref:Primosomal protein N' (Replication factor Y)-superfamily II helicase n=1 Tax=Proteobacteria bacterium 228 TaxID=2083153 RepID=A0A2S5KGM5_9PROT|nr:hypothetical protein [Pokkaliibacter plantistimulans]PPC73920.1 hypothetical protein C4K68_27740 [Pokkaliibacter plantistimulans]